LSTSLYVGTTAQANTTETVQRGYSA
jgi:hypothetical protein